MNRLQALEKARETRLRRLNEKKSLFGPRIKPTKTAAPPPPKPIIIKKTATEAQLKALEKARNFRKPRQYLPIQVVEIVNGKVVNTRVRKPRATATVHVSTKQTKNKSFIQKTFTPTKVDPKDRLKQFRDIEPEIVRFIASNYRGPIKAYLQVNAKYINKDDEIKDAPMWESVDIAILLPTSIADSVRELRNALMNIITSRQSSSQGSGLRLHSVNEIALKLAKYNPTKGAVWFPLDPYLANKKAVVNVQNTDNQCFKWAILSALHPQLRNPQRVSNYLQYADTLDFTGIEFPVQCEDRVYKRFEANNNIALFIYKYDNKKITPAYISKLRGPHVKLLLVEDEKTYGQLTSHYVWIKKWSALMNDQTKNEHKPYVCHLCFQKCCSEDDLNKHLVYCGFTEEPVEFVMETRPLKFTKLCGLEMAPYTVYQDFECSVVKSDKALHQAEADYMITKNIKYTDYSKEHVPNSYCSNLVGIDGYNWLHSYRGEDTIGNYYNHLKSIGTRVNDVYENPMPIQMTEADIDAYEQATHCRFCNKPVVDKVRDHCHITGRYRGAACKMCNINVKIPDFIPVFIHNFRGYDSHLIVKGLTRQHKVKVIAQTMEKFMAMDVCMVDFKGRPFKIRFLDSFMFLSASLDKLTNLNSYPHTAKYFKDKANLMIRKGVYPYDWVNSNARFEEPLPNIKAFYNTLTNKHIEASEYEHAVNVYNTFECRNFGDYHDLYLKTDVLLLTDIFENFRKASMRDFRLDPAWFYSSPNFFNEAMLLMTGIELEQLTADQYLFIERGIKGGMTMISGRYSKANAPSKSDLEAYTNAYGDVPVERKRFKDLGIKTDVDLESAFKYIMYMDCNSLYPTVMVDYLPYGGFEWAETDLNEILNTTDDADTGYFLDVDLEYPVDLHDAHKDYPLAPTPMLVDDAWLTDYQKTMKQKYNINSDKVSKLLNTLHDKTNYVIHYTTLKLYARLGLRVKYVNKVLKFKQSAWMKPYIDFCVVKRATAKLNKNTFEADFYKLAMNSVYGKQLMNRRKHRNIQIVEEKRAEKLNSKGATRNHKILSETYVAVDKPKRKLVFKDPIYVGCAILDKSKEVMYKFWYDNMKAKYGDNVKLLFTDTDSLTMEITTDDVYADLKMNGDLYDFSEYPVDHPLYNPDNAAKLGKFKDEAKGKIIEEFVGLRAKCYSMIIDGDRKMAAKGTPKAAAKLLTHETYKKVLNDLEKVMAQANVIRQKEHTLYSTTINKTALVAFDNKRLVYADHTTLPFGHYSLDI